MVRLELIKVEEGAEEGARGQTEATQEVRAKDYPLAFLRRRRDLLLGARRTRTWSLPGNRRVLRRKSIWSIWTLEPSQSLPYCIAA